jgi:hypothetical protein
MKRHSISMRLNSGAYAGKYLTIKPRLAHWAIWSTNSRALCTGALSRKTYVRLSSCWLNCSKHSTITPIGKPPPLAVRLAQALPFRRAQGIEERRTLNVRPRAYGRGLSDIPGSRLSLQRQHGKGAVLAPHQWQQGVCRAFRPFPCVVGPLWGPSSNYPLCG